MPTVLRVGGFSFRFYSDEHNPPHVHCKYGEGVAIIEIATTRVVRTNRSMRDKDLKRAKALVAEHRNVLEAAWAGYASRRVK